MPLLSIVQQILQPTKQVRRHLDQAHPRSMVFWRGADVTIRPFEQKSIAPVESLSAHIVVVTTHAETLTWLFFSLRDALSSELDYLNKFEFYGRLAEAATRHLLANPNETDDDRPLLLVVFAQALQWLAESQSPKEPFAARTPARIICDGMNSAEELDHDAQRNRTHFDVN